MKNVPGMVAIQGKATPPKDTHPNKNSLHKQFGQTVSACFLLISKGKGGHFVQIVLRVFVQSVFLLGWVFLLGGSSPLQVIKVERVLKWCKHERSRVAPPQNEIGPKTSFNRTHNPSQHQSSAKLQGKPGICQVHSVLQEAQAGKRHININFFVRLVLGRPRVFPGDFTGFVPGTTSVKIWDKPAFSPYFTQSKPGKPGFVPGTNPGPKGGAESLCEKTFMCFFSLAKDSHCGRNCAAFS